MAFLGGEDEEHAGGGGRTRKKLEKMVEKPTCGMRGEERPWLLIVPICWPGSTRHMLKGQTAALNAPPSLLPSLRFRAHFVVGGWINQRKEEGRRGRGDPCGFCRGCRQKRAGMEFQQESLIAFFGFLLFDTNDIGEH